jgi:hypothetical protein
MEISYLVLDLGAHGEVKFPEGIVLQNECEIREMLLTVLSDAELRTVLEIGTWEGGTAYVWGQLVSKYPDGVVVCVDYEFGSDYKGCPHLWGHHIPPIYRGAAFEGQIVEVQGKSNSPDVIRRVGEALGDRKVDFLFIDGEHSYGMAKRDFENYTQFVRDGGWVAFHDIRNKDVTVSDFWKEISPKHGGREILIHEMSDEIQDACTGWKGLSGIGLLQWRGALK